MKDFLDNLGRKPEATRRKIFYGSLAVAIPVVIVVWLLTFMQTVGNVSRKEETAESTIVQDVKEQVSAGRENVRQLLADLNLEMSVPGISSGRRFVPQPQEKLPYVRLPIVGE
jgi:hypothetical protein